VSKNKELEYLLDKSTIIYDAIEALDDKKALKELSKDIPEKTLLLIRALLKKMVHQLDEWHDSDDEDCHSDIRQKIFELEDDFKRHRHDVSQVYSGKAEC